VGADATKLGAIEPSISWLTSGTANAKSNQVLVSGLSTTGFTLTSNSTSGKSYTYVKASTGITKACGSGCTW
jgi:hypothetical protein